MGSKELAAIIADYLATLDTTTRLSVTGYQPQIAKPILAGLLKYYEKQLIQNRE